MPLNVGDRLGHYDVTALIGQGGMGDLKSLWFSYQLFHKSVDLGAVGGVQEGTKREAHATGRDMADARNTANRVEIEVECKSNRRAFGKRIGAP